MSVTGQDWEEALGRLARAHRKAKSAADSLDAAVQGVVDALPEKLILDMCKEARRDLDMALGLVQSLTRGQLS